MTSAARFALALLFAAAFGFAQTAAIPYVIKTVAGTPHVSGDNGQATAVVLRQPQRIAIDQAGNVYIAEQYGYVIRKVTPSGIITTVAGNGVAASASDGNQAASRNIDPPMGLAVDGSGNLYFGEDNLATVRKVSAKGVLSTIAGTSSTGGSSGDGQPATKALLGGLIGGLAFDGVGNLYIADTTNNQIRRIDTNGIMATVAGNGTAGSSGDGLKATEAQLNRPIDVLVDSYNNLYIADQTNNKVRKVTPAGFISTYAGNGTAGSSGDGQSATSAQLNAPVGLAMDSAGRLYVSEQNGARVRQITPTGSGTLIATYAGTGTFGTQGDGGLATSAQLDSPYGLAMDGAGNLYIAESGSSQRIRKVAAGGGVITTFAGTVPFAGDAAPATSALLDFPQSVAADGHGNLYIADTQNQRIRLVAANGTIGTYAGTGQRGATGDGLPATAATFNTPTGVALDSAGSLYIADFYNNRIRKISQAGTITTVAGNGSTTSSGDLGQAVSAGIHNPAAVALGADGSIFIAEQGSNRIRKVDSKGIITTVAGTGTSGYGGDGGQATAALLNSPSGVAVDSLGNLYIADQNNYRVRKVDTHGIITVFAGTGQANSYGGDGGQATAAGIRYVSSVAVDAAGDVFIGDPWNGRIRMVNPSGIISTVAGSGTRSSTGEGVLATTATLGGLNSAGYGMAIGPNGIVYFADTLGETIRELLPNVASQLKLVSGNNQSAAVGTYLPNPLTVTVVGPVGNPLPGIALNFAVTSGAATLSTTITQTDANGVAGVSLNLGMTAGPVVITVTAPGTGLPAVQFTETSFVSCSVPQPVVTSVNSLTDFGGGASFAPGSWLEIKGSNLAQNTRLWTGDDFTGSNAPISLDGVTVLIDGRQAYVEYISPTQLDVQAPADTATGNVALVATAAACPSAPFSIPEAALVPGLLAPASFNIGGKQYLVAQFPDLTYVGNPNLIPGAAFRPAAPGDILTVYGIGFGPVTPAAAPGVIAPGVSSIPNLSIGFGTTPAAIIYGGMAPGTVGEYQFTFTVPNVANGDYPVVFQVGDLKAPQTVYLTVQR